MTSDYTTPDTLYESTKTWAEQFELKRSRCADEHPTIAAKRIVAAYAIPNVAWLQRTIQSIRKNGPHFKLTRIQHL